MVDVLAAADVPLKLAPPVVDQLVAVDPLTATVQPLMVLVAVVPHKLPIKRKL